MPTSSHPMLPRVAEPRIRPFDPWNSGSTGHQRAETKGPLGWRDARNKKLQGQFAPTAAGPARAGTAGAAAARATHSVAEMLARPGTMRRLREEVDKDQIRPRPRPRPRPRSRQDGNRHRDKDEDEDEDEDEYGDQDEEKAASTTAHVLPEPARTPAVEDRADPGSARPPPTRRGILDGLVVYVNGSTFPAVSDHALKRMLVEHGARTSLHLGRRQVTHVIVGRPGAKGAGAGGGLAGGKLEREIRRMGGCAVKYVDVAWVLESIKAGKRLPEARFATVKVAPRGQQSVLDIFSKTDAGSR